MSLRINKKLLSIELELKNKRGNNLIQYLALIQIKNLYIAKHLKTKRYINFSFAN